MTISEQPWTLIAGAGRRVPASTLAFTILLTLMFVAQAAQAQIFTSLHTFTGRDGQEPVAGLAMDRGGNLYGTTMYGGSAGFGAVYKLTHKSGGWVLSTLYSFQGGTDGAFPTSVVTIAADGSLYGTTSQGGSSGCYSEGCGTVWNLRPAALVCKTALCPWTETVLYRFPDFGGSDGVDPVGALTFDQAGNLYGVTAAGGETCGCGVVYKMTHSGGSWTESVIFSFQFSGGMVPAGGVIFDSGGNLYGTTNQGGANEVGTVYELTPSGGGWTETVLHNFQNDSDGSYSAELVFDASGNLYGATFDGGPNGGGTVYQLVKSSGSWTFNLLYAFSGAGFGGQLGGALLLDHAGNVYGATAYGGDHNVGTIFELSPSGNGWAYTSLHSFEFNSSGGQYPNGNLVLDSSGNLYGTTEIGGASDPGYGVIFQIAPAETYTTSFPLSENPIAENGNWLNGHASGLDWQNCATTTNFAFGTQDGSGGYDDSTCIVNGQWSPVQTAMGTVHVTNQTAFQEVEVRLHTTITPHSISGYEINLSVGDNRYAQIVRWNGPLNDFTYLNGITTGPIHNGDVLKATIDANGMITVYINGVEMMTAVDTTFPTGSPGMGFYSSGGTNTNFGFSSFTARAGN